MEVCFIPLTPLSVLDPIHHPYLLPFTSIHTDKRQRQQKYKFCLFLSHIIQIKDSVINNKTWKKFKRNFILIKILILN